VYDNDGVTEFVLDLRHLWVLATRHVLHMQWFLFDDARRRDFVGIPF
jgi:hypothetical protein